MDFVHDVIAWKRDGKELDEPRVRAFVDGVVSGAVPSYQASALLMAMVLRGLSDDETLWLARAMVDSGKLLDLSVLRRPVLDKHSSGGVGDKVTLVLAPLVAACGAIFGKMSGRGLGHTGGTLDKLESIPGFRVQLPQGDFLRQLERIGVAVVSQSERIVPGRPAAVRAPRRHGDGGVQRADRGEHHGQEGGQRHLGARARPQGGPRRVRGRSGRRPGRSAVCAA